MTDELRNVLLCYLENTSYNAKLINDIEQLEFWYIDGWVKQEYFTYFNSCEQVTKQPTKKALQWHQNVKWGELRGCSLTEKITCICPTEKFIAYEPKCTNTRCEIILNTLAGLLKIRPKD